MSNILPKNVKGDSYWAFVVVCKFTLIILMTTTTPYFAVLYL